jgi:hypothetical protein
MVYFGTVMETGPDKTYVFTMDCEMITIKSKEEYFTGQQISFHKKDLYKTIDFKAFADRKNFRIISAIAAAFLCVILIGGAAFFNW